MAASPRLAQLRESTRHLPPLHVSVRLMALALVALQLVSFVPLLPAYFSLAAHLCRQGCLLTITHAGALERAGIAPAVYVGGVLAGTIVNLLVSATLAGILIMRRSRDRTALITAYFVMILPTSLMINLAPVQIGDTQVTAFPLPAAFDLLLAALQSGVIFGMPLVFPTGRFVPRWSWALLLSFVIFTTVFSVRPDVVDVLVPIWPVFFGSAFACIVYRYVRVFTAPERQQTKWVIFGLVTFLVAAQVYWLPTFTPLNATVYTPLAYLLYQALLSVVPLTFFIAIQRYRLYDIDILINRTLVYGSLTVSLAAVYFGSVVAMQRLAAVLAGPRAEANPLIIVVSTLLIAALFQPLRRHLQRVIDRHFYRRKYDAAKTLAAFGASLQAQTDLPQLSEHLVAVVEETMQPTHVALWLRPQPTRAE